MVIGSLGKVVFEVSRTRVRTFDSYKRSGASRWATHEVISKKQVLEFLGPGIESISFTMYFSVSLGVSPHTELQQLRQMLDSGQSYPLIIAESLVGSHSWVIKSLGESVNKFDAAGNILSAQVDVALDEYVDTGNMFKTGGV